MAISIHVPSWGTTNLLANCKHGKQFQSTFPRGERRINEFYSIKHRNFNPRSLVGNDQILPAILELWNIFQSTFPRGERPQT